MLYNLSMNKFIAHFILITKHRHRVIRNAAHLGIFFHSLGHDLSKYSSVEFKGSYKYYNGVRSPIYNERKDHGYYSDVFVHHTSHNKHHFEYYMDFCGNYTLTKNIPYIYCLEIVADMISASSVYMKKNYRRDSVVKYLEGKKATSLMTDATYEFIHWCLVQYAESGFKHLKKKNTKPKYLELVNKYEPYKYYRLTEASKYELKF